MKEAKCILQDVLILEPGRRIELITVHAQSKRVVEFHFSLKCPLLFIYCPRRVPAQRPEPEEAP